MVFWIPKPRIPDFTSAIFHDSGIPKKKISRIPVHPGDLMFMEILKCLRAGSQRSKAIYKACCWDCNDFYIGRLNTTSPLQKMLSLQLHCIADHVTATGHNIKWGHFKILASGKTDYHCKIKEHFLNKQGLKLTMGSPWATREPWPRF